MYLVEFIGVIPRTGEIEVDVDSVDTREEARELAIKAIQQAHPDLEDIQILEMKEIE